MGLSRISLENFRNHAVTNLGETARFAAARSADHEAKLLGRRQSGR